MGRKLTPAEIKIVESKIIDDINKKCEEVNKLNKEKITKEEVFKKLGKDTTKLILEYFDNKNKVYELNERNRKILSEVNNSGINISISYYNNIEGFIEGYINNNYKIIYSSEFSKDIKFKLLTTQIDTLEETVSGILNEILNKIK